MHPKVSDLAAVAMCFAAATFIIVNGHVPVADPKWLGSVALVLGLGLAYGYFQKQKAFSDEGDLPKGPVGDRIRAILLYSHIFGAPVICIALFLSGLLGEKTGEWASMPLLLIAAVQLGNLARTSRIVKR